MLSRLKSLKNTKSNSHDHDDREKSRHLRAKFVYSRPKFLKLDTDIAASDKQLRAIITPLDPTSLPWNTGYAECVNGGKSLYNEDQAAVGRFTLPCQPGHASNGIPNNNNNNNNVQPAKFTNLEVTYMGIFDGHAGTEAAVMVSNELTNHLQEKLLEVRHELMDLGDGVYVTANSPITAESLITGALESSFCAMDEQIGREKSSFSIKGGCTSLLALFIRNFVFVANAGDCRAIVCMDGEIIPMSRELSPASEIVRLQTMALTNPMLLRNEFSSRVFHRRLLQTDIGHRVLCRNPMSHGWSYHEASPEDIKPPMVRAEGKKSRLMDTIGVSRCLGDHDLVVFGTDIRIKPFLIPNPEVRSLKLDRKLLKEEDVLIMGSDGLWDVMGDEEAYHIVMKTLHQYKAPDPLRYTMAAKALVSYARGTRLEKGWTLETGNDASFDDITVFIIPLRQNPKKITGTRL